MDEREFEVLSQKGKIMSKAVKNLWNLSEDERRTGGGSLALEKQQPGSEVP